MDGFTNEELSEALRSITSTLNKSQKVLLKTKRLKTIPSARKKHIIWNN